jgi:hypothetical protein
MAGHGVCPYRTHVAPRARGVWIASCVACRACARSCAGRKRAGLTGLACCKSRSCVRAGLASNTRGSLRVGECAAGTEGAGSHTRGVGKAACSACGASGIAGHGKGSYITSNTPCAIGSRYRPIHRANLTHGSLRRRCNASRRTWDTVEVRHAQSAHILVKIARGTVERAEIGTDGHARRGASHAAQARRLARARLIVPKVLNRRAHVTRVLVARCARHLARRAGEASIIK